MYIYRHPHRNQQRCKRAATERLGWSWIFGLFPWRDYRWTIAHLLFGLLSLDAIYTLTHTCNLPSEGQQCFIAAKKSVITTKLSIWKKQNKNKNQKTNPFTVQRKHTDSDQYDSDWNLGVKVNKMIGTCTAKHGLLQMIILTDNKKNHSTLHSDSHNVWNPACFQQTRSRRFPISLFTHKELVLIKGGNWMAWAWWKVWVKAADSTVLLCNQIPLIPKGNGTNIVSSLQLKSLRYPFHSWHSAVVK